LLEADLWLCTFVAKEEGVAGGCFRREIRGFLQSRRQLGLLVAYPAGTWIWVLSEMLCRSELKVKHRMGDSVLSELILGKQVLRVQEL
jgi:hypothetical protein